MSGVFSEDRATFLESAQVPVGGDYDVIVVGGGPAGIAAALSSARHGKKALLIESYGFLGGMWTMGMVMPFFDQENKGGICQELVTAIEKTGQYVQAGPEMWVCDLEEMKLLLDRLLVEAGVELLLHTHFAAPIVQDGTIQGIIVENKGGRTAYTARVVIDCTGDGDVAARAGVPFDIGRPGDHQVQPMTMMFRMSNVTYVQDYYTYRHYESNELFPKLQDAMERAGVTNHDFNYKRPCVIRMPGIHTALCQATHIRQLLATDPVELTKAEIEGRQEVKQLFELLHTYLPEFKYAHVDVTGPHIGIRESRRLRGEYHLTLEDVEQNRQFDDGICTVTFWVDIHQPDGVDQDAQHGALLRPSFQIPYRSLVPLGVENLLIAGRCISGSYEAHASYRVTGNCVAMGQAAGIAAALSLETQKPPRQINGADVVKQMVADGAVCRVQ